MKIQVFPLKYKGQKRIGIRPLGFDRDFPTLMKKIPGNRWTPDEKCWHIPYQQAAYAELKRLFGERDVGGNHSKKPKPKSEKAFNE